MFEQKSAPVLTRTAFYLRLGRSFLATVAIIVFSLALGSAGYRYFGGLESSRRESWSRRSPTR